MLDEQSLTGILEQLQGELVAAEAEYARVQHRVNALRQAVGGLKGLLASKAGAEDIPAGSLTATGTTRSSGRATLGPVDAEAKSLQETGKAHDELVVTVEPPLQVPPAGRPRGAEAIRRVFEENEGIGWTIREMTAELDRRGWTPNSKNPVDAVRTAMLRAWRAPNSGIIREGSKFVYRSGSTPSPAAADPSPNGAEPMRAEEVSDDQEVNGAAPTLTGGERWS